MYYNRKVTSKSVLYNEKPCYVWSRQSSRCHEDFRYLKKSCRFLSYRFVGFKDPKRRIESRRLPRVVGEREAQSAPERPSNHGAMPVVCVAAVPWSRHHRADCAVAGEWRTARVLRQTYVQNCGSIQNRGTKISKNIFQRSLTLDTISQGLEFLRDTHSQILKLNGMFYKDKPCVLKVHNVL